MTLSPVKTLALLWLLSLAMSNVSPAATESPLSPEILIINAAIHTMDQTRPTASALAIVGDRIAAVGSTAEIRVLAGPKTRIIDAGQKLVLAQKVREVAPWLDLGLDLAPVDGDGDLGHDPHAWRAARLSAVSASCRV